MFVFRENFCKKLNFQLNEVYYLVQITLYTAEFEERGGNYSAYRYFIAYFLLIELLKKISVKNNVIILVQIMF